MRYSKPLPNPAFSPCFRLSRSGEEARNFWYDPESASFSQIRFGPVQECLDADAAMKRSAALAGLTLAALACGGALYSRLDRNESDREELVRTIGSRPFEPRLTGDFRYLPCKASPAPASSADIIPEPACQGALTAGSDRRDSVMRLGARAQDRTDSIDGLWTWAVALLSALPEERGADEAIQALQTLTVREPEGAAGWSDLAAAYIVRAQRSDDPFDLFLALAAANRAVQLDPKLAEARFNLALVLEKLFANGAARSAWLAYLNLDRDSEWAGEAAERLQRLSTPAPTGFWDADPGRIARTLPVSDPAVEALVRAQPQAARETAEIQLLSGWAEARSQGDPKTAALFLAAARAVGDALARVNGERLTQDSVAAIDGAAARGDWKRLQQLVRGHQAFGKGFQLYDQVSSTAAQPLFEESRDALAAAGSPFADRASFYLVCGEFNQERYAQAVTAAWRLRRELTGQPYPALSAQLAWMEGTIQLVRGYPVESLQPYQQALDLFEALGERGNVAAVHTLFSASLERLGRAQDSWQEAYLGLQGGPEIRNPRLYSMVSLQAADFALRQGYPHVALYLQAELVSRARRASVVQFVSALANRGLTYAQAGQSALALEALRRASRWIERIDDPATVKRAQADIALYRGMVLSETEPSRAVDLLSEAIGVYRQTGHHLQALIAYRARAHAYRALHDLESAEGDLRLGLEANEQLGQGIAREEAKLVFLNQVTRLFDEMIAFQAEDRERFDLAFTYADRARTQEIGAASVHLRLEPADRQELLDAEPEPVRPAEVRAALPAGTSLVEYSVLDDRVLIWLLSRDGLRYFEQKVEQADLAGRVERWRDAIVHSRPGAGASDLDSLLIAPWISQVAPGERLIFVPDKDLVGLPFAALRDPRTGRYLIEDHVISVAPSAAFYMQAHGRARLSWPSQNSPKALLLGNPKFDPDWFDNLDDLPDAAAEIRALGGLYEPASGSRALTGAEVDKDIFLDLAPQFPIVHYAGHTSYNAEHPLLSALVLAPDRDKADSGALYAWEIYRMDLRRNWLVILSACGPEGQGAVSGAGGMSLPRAFLAAGSPNVIASLWSAEDISSSRFFTRFHRELRNTWDPAQALRQTQLAMLKSPNPRDRRPVVWAGFELFGSKPDRPNRPH